MVLSLMAILTFTQPKIEPVYVSQPLDSSQTFHTYRIPAICRTSKGTLLAFAEARRSLGDTSSNTIVLKRKEAGQANWSNLDVVVTEVPHSLNNPTVIATDKGKIWLMYQRYPAGMGEWDVKPFGDYSNSCRSFILTSDDDGKSWSSPVDISSVVRPDGIRSVATGPGVGIQIQEGPHAGRLVFPVNQGVDRAWTAFTVYSDDEGKTWKRGEAAEHPAGMNPNECQVVELNDGVLLMNARNQGAAKVRLQATSHDGGQTWTEFEPAKELIDPVCMGSIVRLSDNPLVIGFSNPESTSGRKNGVLKLSADGGKTWSKELTITEGSFGYSCLVPLPNHRVGVLYESIEMVGEQEGYRLLYAEFDWSL